jgi:acyl-coenzyme A synthetase/AMP-(fatty) acid ligase
MDLIRYQALITPGRIAIRSKYWNLTYPQLVDIIDGLILRLRENGISAGTSVSVALGSAKFNIFLLSLALLDSGCFFVSRSAAADNAVVPDYLITDSITQVAIKQIIFDASWFEETCKTSKIPSNHHQSGTAFFGTSGSVGARKIVALSEQQLATRVQSHSFGFGHAVISRQWGTLLGPGNLFGYLSYLSPLIRGGTLILNSGSTVDVNSNLDAIEHLTLSPQILALYLEDDNLNEATFKNLKSIMISGSAAPQVLVERAFSRLGVEIYSSYGSTEVGPIANMQLTAGIESHDAVGYVYPWIDLEIVDEGSPVSEGEEGLIRIRSPYMADQYHADPASTERSYKDGWFYPGDLGQLTEGRLLHVTGRVNEVINIGGLKIAPHKIEHFVRAQPQVRDAAAFGNPSESGVDQVWLAIVTSGPVDFTNLHQKCVERFGPVAAPVRILHVTTIPRTETGKIQRSRLKALLAQGSKQAPMTS